MFLHYPSRTWNRRILKAITCLLLIFVLLTKSHPVFSTKRPYDTWAWDKCPGVPPSNKSSTASRASIAQDVQIVVKTGGSEPQIRLRSQLATILSNITPENILLFSDLEENIESFHVHDVYAGISEQERTHYPEFAHYDELQTYQQQKRDTRELQGGWDLAKYMNLAMKWKIWKMQQEAGNAHLQRKWFVFIDTDTFVDWDNMHVFLDHFDARKKLYMGSPVWLPKLQFAHGGSGYIVSYAALKALNVPSHGGPRQGPVHSQFGLNTTALCCGDEALARALKQRHIRLNGYWPMFNGETPATVGFGDEVWCSPVISLHHISGTDMEDLWRWVAGWKARTMSRVRKFIFVCLIRRFFHKSTFEIDNC